MKELSAAGNLWESRGSVGYERLTYPGDNVLNETVVFLASTADEGVNIHLCFTFLAQMALVPR